MSDGGPDLVNAKVMSLFDHLHDLRKTLTRSLLAVLVCFIVAMCFANHILNWLKAPLVASLPQGSSALHFTGPMDVFVAGIQVSAVFAILAAAPVWTYQFWMFVEPALYSHEKKYVVPFAVASMALFGAGVAFCYWVMLPLTLSFLIGMGMEVGTPMITISDYISMVGVMLIAFGLIFETPVILVLLGMLDLVDPDDLASQRGVALVVILIIAAILTPPDPVSQIGMAIPMYLMFEMSLLLMRWMRKTPAK